MLDIQYNGVNIYNPIEGQIEKIIEYFVEFYGEDKRQMIENKIKNTTFLFVSKSAGPLCDLSFVLHSKVINYIDGIINEMCKKYKLGDLKSYTFFTSPDLIRETRDNLANGGIVNDSYFEIFAGALGIKCSVDECSPKQKQRVCDFMTLFLNEYDEKYKSLVDELIAKNEEFSLKISEILPNFIKIKEKQEKFIKDYKQEYFNKLLKRLGICAKEEEQEKYFSTFCNLLNYSQDSKVIPLFLEKDFNELFKFLGSKEVYWKDDKQLLQQVYNKELLNDIQLCMERAEDLLKRNNKSYNNAIDVLNTLNFAYEKDQFAIKKCIDDFVTDVDTMGFASNYLDSNGELMSICVCTDYITLASSSLVHELQHIIDSNLAKNSEEFYVVKCGLDLCAFSKVEKITKDKHSFYEYNCNSCSMFDEILTEYLSQKVMALMNRDLYNIGLNSNMGSAYQKGFYVFNKIISDNEKFWINARSSLNLYVAKRYIGEVDYEVLSLAATKIISGTVDVVAAIKEIESKTKKKITYKNAHFCEKLQGKFDFSENAEEFIKLIKSVNAVNDKLKKKLKATLKAHVQDHQR